MNRNKQLIEAVRLIRENCYETYLENDSNPCNGCIFYNGTDDCCDLDGIPFEWNEV